MEFIDDNSLVTVVVYKKYEREVNHQFHLQQYHTSTSQKFPIASWHIFYLLVHQSEEFGFSRAAVWCCRDHYI